MRILKKLSTVNIKIYRKVYKKVYKKVNKKRVCEKRLKIHVNILSVQDLIIKLFLKRLVLH